MVQTVAMIGAGSMSEAIIAGMVKQAFIPSEHIFVMNKSDEARLKLLQETYGITYIQNKKNALSEVDVVVLSVKPKDIPVAIQSINSELHSNQLIISVAAGVSTDTIQKEIGLEIPVIRRSEEHTSELQSRFDIVC